MQENPINSLKINILQYPIIACKKKKKKYVFYFPKMQKQIYAKRVATEENALYIKLTDT